MTYLILNLDTSCHASSSRCFSGGGTSTDFDSIRAVCESRAACDMFASSMSPPKPKALPLSGRHSAASRAVPPCVVPGWNAGCLRSQPPGCGLLPVLPLPETAFQPFHGNGGQRRWPFRNNDAFSLIMPCNTLVY